jgi:protein-export membrane protein SecD
MLRFSNLKIVLILLTTVVSILLAVPNLLNVEQRAAIERSIPAWVPKWLVPTKTVTLGLDLQGGSHVLLEVDVNDLLRTKVLNLRDDVRRVLREEKVVPQGGIGVQPRGVQMRIAEQADREKLLPKLRALAEPIGNQAAIGGGGQRSSEVSEGADGIIQVTITEAGTTDRVRRAAEQAIEVLRRRVDALGTTEPNIQRQGSDRILVQVPGLQDPQRLKEILGKTAKLQFRMVSESGGAASEVEQLPSKDEAGAKIPIERRVIVEGDDLVDAQPAFDSRSSEPIVNFRFNVRGAQKFGQVTSESIGRRLAIVLDNEVVSAPVIQSAITGGSGQISGRFTVEAANNLALLLRAGALPAKLTIVEERTVGPGLGQDSIEAGKTAAYVATAIVSLFMIVSYGIFGVFANLALIVHVFIIFALMSLIGATLTLPGIAGIVLGIGMAVDANVLIYERIREEQQLGRSPLMALEAGFERALATIVDSNATQFLAAVILFYVGTGPVRGFAVTLIVGIATTVFTAFTLTRLMSVVWFRWKKPTRIPLG